MTRRYHTSRPHESVMPRQRRHTDWGHGKILPMDEIAEIRGWAAREGEPPLWLGPLVFLGGLIAACAFGFLGKLLFDFVMF